MKQNSRLSFPCNPHSFHLFSVSSLSGSNKFLSYTRKQLEKQQQMFCFGTLPVTKFSMFWRKSKSDDKLTFVFCAFTVKTRKELTEGHALLVNIKHWSSCEAKLYFQTSWCPPKQNPCDCGSAMSWANRRHCSIWCAFAQAICSSCQQTKAKTVSTEGAPVCLGLSRFNVQALQKFWPHFLPGNFFSLGQSCHLRWLAPFPPARLEHLTRDKNVVRAIFGRLLSVLNFNVASDTPCCALSKNRIRSSANLEK